MKSRYWFVVIQIENMKKAVLTAEQINDPVYVANYFLNRWTESAPSRTGCVTVCRSADGLYSKGNEFNIPTEEILSYRFFKNHPQEFFKFYFEKLCIYY